MTCFFAHALRIYSIRRRLSAGAGRLLLGGPRRFFPAPAFGGVVLGARCSLIPRPAFFSEAALRTRYHLGRSPTIRRIFAGDAKCSDCAL